MVATKMFWDMWRNLTNATSNWTSGGGGGGGGVGGTKSSCVTKSSRSRYNRLRSSFPTKSYSQPANLASFLEDPTTSLESLAGGTGETGSCKTDASAPAVPDQQSIKKNNKTIKHSFTTSSFLPFSSCSFSRENESSCSSTSSAGKNPQTTTQTGINNKGDDDNMVVVGRIPSRNGQQSPSSSSSATNIAKTNDEDARGTQSQQKADEFCVVEHVISDLDEEDDDDHLSCDVCARAFSTFRQLADHQRKKRHYGCLQCDTLFTNQHGLDCHREQMCHYQFAVDMAGYRDYGDDDDTDSFITDDDENGFGYSDDGDDEEMERLL